jgi:hypothetical protein
MALEYLELFFGKTMTGKTARMMHEVRNEPRLVVVDPKCGQLAELEDFDHLWPEYRPGKGGGWTGEHNPADYFRGRNGKFRVVVHVREHFAEQLDRLCLLARAVRNLCLCVDELGLFPNPVVSDYGDQLPQSRASLYVQGICRGPSGAARLRVHHNFRP